MLNAIYLDYNASAPLRPEARQAMIEAFVDPANPSSVHQFGQKARSLVENARIEVAALAGCHHESVIFCSGGTEANMMALKAVPEKTIITSPTEHIAVLSAAPEAVMVKVNSDGLVDIDHLRDLLKIHQGRALVSIMAANNETGIIQPLDDIIRLAHEYDTLVHSDAIQYLGKGLSPMDALGLDMMSVSAHKIGGPTGVGALLVRQGLQIPPFITGGGQEKNRRGGTENFLGIIGFGAAAKATALTDPAHFDHLRQCHDQFEARILEQAPDAHVFGENTARLFNTTSIAMPSRLAEAQVMGFDLTGIAISAGSACSSGKVSASHVLKAMGAGKKAERAIRISSGWNSKDHEFDKCADIWLQLWQKTV